MITIPKTLHRPLVLAGTLLLAVAAFANIASATHAWGPYHWARTSNPFTLKLGDNVSSTWDAYLATTASDWSLSDVLDTTVVGGQAKGSCRPTAGRVEVCAKAYGATGWLGLAQIWINPSNHITQGTAKMNDTYFNTATYNTPGWRSLVMCQEVGHPLGLGHQDEDFNNPPITPHTCMDYFVPGTDEIVHPNQHDYDELALIYAHLDSSTTVGASLPLGGKGVDIDLESPPAWGKVLHEDGDGNPSIYVRELGGGERLFTFVFWTKGEHGRGK